MIDYKRFSEFRNCYFDFKYLMFFIGVDRLYYPIGLNVITQDTYNQLTGSFTNRRLTMYNNEKYLNGLEVYKL